jgi:hypothetical protein
MSEETQKVKIRETVTLKKFEGDDQTQEPVETITIEFEDGEEVRRTITKKGDSNEPTH